MSKMRVIIDFEGTDDVLNAMRIALSKSDNMVLTSHFEDIIINYADDMVYQIDSHINIIQTSAHDINDGELMYLIAQMDWIIKYADKEYMDNDVLLPLRHNIKQTIEMLQNATQLLIHKIYNHIIDNYLRKI
jgi:hypothetical protein